MCVCVWVLVRVCVGDAYINTCECKTKINYQTRKLYIQTELVSAGAVNWKDALPSFVLTVVVYEGREPPVVE